MNKYHLMYTATWVNLEDMLRDISHHRRTVLYDFTSMRDLVKFVETESRMVVDKAWQEGAVES